MQIGFIGLGKMGKNMVLHLREQGIEVVAYNRTPTDLSTVQSIPDFLTQLSPPAGGPCVIWLMVAAGTPVDEVLDSLTTSGLQKGDIVIDGGNSFYKDSIRRYDKLLKSGINYIDCGTSGGLEGGRTGACLMLGGDQSVIEGLRWLWDALSAGPAARSGSALVANENFDPSSEAARESTLPPIGHRVEAGQNFVGSPRQTSSWAYLGPSGAGHFVKMVHNGVEYGMDQAIGEGFEILSRGPYNLNLQKVADVWNHGSVVRGWLIELLARALVKDPRLDTLTGAVGGGETGAWALATAKELGIDAKILEDAIAARKKSLTSPTFSTKVVSALRREYGGHKEGK